MSPHLCTHCAGHTDGGIYAEADRFKGVQRMTSGSSRTSRGVVAGTAGLLGEAGVAGAPRGAHPACPPCRPILS